MNSNLRTNRQGVAQRTYLRNMMSNMTTNYERRRRQDVGLDQPDAVTSLPPLNVQLVEFYSRQNAQVHNTDQFELVQDQPSTPVLRRGQPFYMFIRFDRPIDFQEDLVKLIFDFGPYPNLTKGTRAILQLENADAFTKDSAKWDVRVSHCEQTDCTVEIQIPTICQVGIWRCCIRTYRRGHNMTPREFKANEDIYILFNPWCKSDAVYMCHEEERREYVLNDVGKLWMGSFRQPKGRRWIFGQFDDVVLPTTMYLLELSGLPHSERGNPVKVSRAISAVINSDDESGLVIGRWDGDYRDGLAPHAWTGSVAIMEQYLRESGNPVKYGQCWVFSGLVTSVCRALGIPCRSVTNYVSAHDTNATLTVDKYFDRWGNEISGGPDGECYDSCWNFHVWNDVWMSRPDLPPGYGGWQIIDATPQEASDHLYRCGPASVEAVKQGKVGFLYDTPFVFAEVNADVCHFQEDHTSRWGFSRLQVNKYHVGRKIVTKMMNFDDDNGDTDMWDVTEDYKNPEGSNDERLAVFNAVRGMDSAQKYYDFPEKHEEDVEFDLIEIDEVQFGQPFDIVVHVENKSGEHREVEAVLSASSVYYTGVTVNRLKRDHRIFVLQPYSREIIQVPVFPDDYMDKLVDHSLIKIYAIANVKNTRQTWSEEDDFPLAKPRLDIQIDGPLTIGQQCIATFSFTNTLPIRLTNCTFNVEGPGLQRPKTISFRDVEPGENVSYTEHFYPKKSGERRIMATFVSTQLTEINGSTTITIQE